MMKKTISTVLASLALVLVAGCAMPSGNGKGHIELQLAVDWEFTAEPEVDEASEP